MTTLVQRTFAGVMRKYREIKVEKEQKKTAEQLRKQILHLFWRENKSYRDIAGLLDVSHTTVWRIVQENEPPLSVRMKLAKFGPLVGAEI
ncbi:helix-turn-helix domain-containing protein [Candidatus Micrarchaeota archaeon]|nr:helix-turn-helix domain-containing protein [Candidatus Micrarchaeota archaeon]